MNGDTRELLGAWALDAVDDVERAAVERALREDPQLADEARALTETAAMLAVHGAVAPPATLRAAVLDRIATEPQAGTVAPRRTTTRRGGARWLAVAAAFLVATGVPTVIAVQQSQRADQVQQQADAIADVLGRPGAQVVQADVTGGGRAVAVIADGAAVFTADDLPALDDRDYQLWVVADGDPVSAGVLDADGGSATTQVGDVPEGSALAVTVEPVGGSEQPTTDPVVVLAAG